MAIRKITFPQQVSGDRWTTEKVNEIKDVVNSNADRLSEVSNEVGAATAELRRTVSKGIFLYGTNLSTAVDSPRIGDWCVVLGSGNVFPGTVYTYNGTTWTAGGSWSPNGTVDLADYPTKAEMEETIEEHAVEIADNLETQETGKVLDARQGFVLAGQIGGLNGTAKELTRWGWYNEGSDILPLYSVTSKRYIIEDGSGLGSSSACQVTEFISVEHIDRLAYRLRRQAGMCTIAAYSDKDMGTFIADNSVIRDSSSGSGTIEGIWQKQEGTNYIRCTLWADYTNYLKNPDAEMEIDIQPTKGSGNPVSSDAVANALEGISNSIGTIRDEVDMIAEDVSTCNTLVSKIEGGELESVADGKTLKNATARYHYLTVDNIITRKSSNSYSNWVIANSGYKKIRVYTRFNTSSAPAGVACVLLCFAVGSDFVFDETKGYVQAGSFVYYPDHAVSTSQNGGNYYWLTVNGDEYIEIPEGTTSICVTCRCATTTTTPQIWLYSTEVVKGIEKDVEELKEAVFGGGEQTITTNLGANNGQDCLLLRNHIESSWPYYLGVNNQPTSYDDLNYLDGKIKNVPEGKHFIFVTDVHWKDSTSRRSNYIASYVSKRLGGCTVIFGGDAVNSGATRFHAANDLSVYADAFFSAFGDNSLWVQGNHDANYVAVNAGSVTAEEGLIDDREIYKRTVARLSHKVIFDAESIESIQDIGLTEDEVALGEAWIRLHYHWDDNKQSIRYIIFETGNGGLATRRLVRAGVSYIIPLQFTWLERVLKSTPEGYDVVILGHEWTQKTGDSDTRNMMKILRAYMLNGSTTVNMRAVNTSEGTPFARALCGTAANRTFSFVENNKSKGRIMVIGGHWHVDRAYVFYTQDGVLEYPRIYPSPRSGEEYLDMIPDGGILNVVTACDNNSANRSKYLDGRSTTPGSTDEVLFDVMTITDDDRLVCTRIGFGDDRNLPLTYGDGVSIYPSSQQGDDETPEDEDPE